MQSIEMSHQEKLRRYTIQPKSLLSLEYQPSFILIDLRMITSSMIQTIRGTAIVMNH